VEVVLRYPELAVTYILLLSITVTACPPNVILVVRPDAVPKNDPVTNTGPPEVFADVMAADIDGKQGVESPKIPE